MFALKDLTATLCAVLVALFAMAVSVSAEEKAPAKAKAQASKSATAKTAKAEAVDERDFYTRRAQEMLDADSPGADGKPHALAKDFPEQYVVVCTGGCKNHQAHIVDMEPRQPQKTTEIGEMIPTAAGGSAKASLSSAVVCVGGCPRGDTIHFTSADVGDFVNDWESLNSAPSSGEKAESGRWLSDQN